VKEVAQDGNCFFWTMAYLINGEKFNKEQAMSIRKTICDYIEHTLNWDKIGPYIDTLLYPNGKKYVDRNNLRGKINKKKKNDWATEVVIFATAQITGKDIFTYSRGSWLRFLANGTSKRPTIHAFHMNHRDLNHYEPVLAP
jgi:hypothetical protein